MLNLNRNLTRNLFSPNPDSTDGANEEELEPFGTFDEHEGRFKNHAPSTNSYNYGGEYDQDYEVGSAICKMRC